MANTARCSGSNTSLGSGSARCELSQVLNLLPAFQRLTHAEFHVGMVHHAIALAGVLPRGALGDLLLEGAVFDAELVAVFV